MEDSSLWGRFRRGALRIVASLGHGGLLFLFALPFLLFVYLKSTAPSGTEMEPGGWGGLAIDYESLQWWAIVSSVLFFGALGSTVSFFSRQDLTPKEITKTRTLLGAQLLGAVFAILLFLAFVGGLVQGTLFPNFRGVGGTDLNWFSLLFFPSDWAKLMVWSFVAGFSERFVPDLLNNLILRAGRDEDANPRQADAYDDRDRDSGRTP